MPSNNDKKGFFSKSKEDISQEDPLQALLTAVQKKKANVVETLLSGHNFSVDTLQTILEQASLAKDEKTAHVICNHIKTQNIDLNYADKILKTAETDLKKAEALFKALTEVYLRIGKENCVRIFNLEIGSKAAKAYFSKEDLNASFVELFSNAPKAFHYVLKHLKATEKDFTFPSQETLLTVAGTATYLELFRDLCARKGMTAQEITTLRTNILAQGKPTLLSGEDALGADRYIALTPIEQPDIKPSTGTQYSSWLSPQPEVPVTNENTAWQQRADLSDRKNNKEHYGYLPPPVVQIIPTNPRTLVAGKFNEAMPNHIQALGMQWRWDGYGNLTATLTVDIQHHPNLFKEEVGKTLYDTFGLKSLEMDKKETGRLDTNDNSNAPSYSVSEAAQTNNNQTTYIFLISKDNAILQGIIDLHRRNLASRSSAERS